MLKIERLLAGAYEENAYLAWVEGSGEALMVDPGGRADMLMSEVEKRGLTLTHILLTHGHFDHILAVPELLRRTNAKVWVHELDESMLFDTYPLKLPWQFKAQYEPLKLTEEQKLTGREFDFAGITIRMIETPGHSPGSVCYYAPDERIMFTGDTLFDDGCGRTDFANGRESDMQQSLAMLFRMDPEIHILPGHGDGDALGAVKRRFGL